MPGGAFDPYRLLGVPRGASVAEVTRAYRRLAKQLHPDLHGADAGAAMQELNRAVRMLTDPERRRVLDEEPRQSPRREHWGPIPPPPADPRRGAGHRLDAVWEPARGAGASATHGRVRPAGAWPRAQSLPKSAPGVRDSAWLAAIVALLVVAGAILLAWIASTGSLATNARTAVSRIGVAPITGFQPDPGHEVDVYRRPNGIVGLVVATRDENGWTATVLTEATMNEPLSVLLHAEGSGGSGPLPSIAFGRAEGGVVEVRIAGSGGHRASVVDGTWVMPVPGLSDAAEVDWEFVLVDGSVITGGGQPPG